MASRATHALPLYSKQDAQRAIDRLTPVRDGSSASIGKPQVSLSPVGHLLGACAVRLRGDAQSLVFSGDLGRRADLLMPPPQTITRADMLLIKSTCGNRLHPGGDVQAQLAEVVTRSKEAEALTRLRYPCVIISASGMATGGRVLFHLKSLAPKPRNHIVFTGLQVGGTRGAKLIAGATEVKSSASTWR